MFVLIWLPAFESRADGGYFSKRSVAVSTDQRAIIIKDGNEISMTFSTGYTGEGEDFGWIIPTPVPPVNEDVSEAGEIGEAAFKNLDKYSAPVFSAPGGGCFPSGTEVLTASGPRAIETVGSGTRVYACDLVTGQWILTKVLKRLSHQYEGDMIAIRIRDVTIQATGNHPFYVLRGDRLASRPPPQDIPREELRMVEHGRWVEARDLKGGDVLQDRRGEGLIVTTVSSRHEKMQVYNLNVEGYHNYAVHDRGVLVHNKGGSEAAPREVVKVYGRVTLDHYEVSILGATVASALLNWLQENKYQVNPGAQEVLDSYIDLKWAFVAIKLKPSEKRHYTNEFLPPITIKYRYSQLIFPLAVSSLSTTKTAKITLYVIAESTVSSSNFPTVTLQYEDRLSEPLDPQKYIEARIRRTLADAARGLVVMWSGEFVEGAERQAVDELMGIPPSGRKKMYLTRLETRIDPSTMTEDITFMLDPRPKEFRVRIQATAGFPRSQFLSVAVDVGGNVYAAGLIYGTGTYDFGGGVTAKGIVSNGDNAILVKYNSSGGARWARTVTAGSGSISFNLVSVDARGNVYAAGGGSTGKTSVLVKYDSSGRLHWVHTVTTGYDFHSLAVDAGANVYAAGQIDLRRAFTVKYNPSGFVQWVREVVPGYGSRFNSIAVDANGNMYAAGYVKGTGTFSFGGGIHIIGASSRDDRPGLVLVKFNSSGVAKWARKVTPAPDRSELSSVAVDAGGNVYVAACLLGTEAYDFGGGVTAFGDSVLVKYNSSGVARWARTVRERYIPKYGSWGIGSSVAVDAAGNVYSVGQIFNPGTSDFGGGVTARGSDLTGYDEVVVKYDPSGVAQWARTVTADPKSYSLYTAVATDARGNVYAAYDFSEPGIFGFGGGVIATATYGPNVVLVKYDSSGVTQWARMVSAGLD